MSKGCGARAFAADMLGRMSNEDKALGLRSSNACTSSQAAGLKNKHNHIVRYSSGPSYLHGGDSNLVAGLDGYQTAGWAMWVDLQEWMTRVRCQTQEQWQR